MWRYRELLPIDGEPTVGMQVGFTPLVKADRLAKALGVREVYVKNDTVNYPTLSFKDRVVVVGGFKRAEVEIADVNGLFRVQLAALAALQVREIGRRFIHLSWSCSHSHQDFCCR